MEENFDQEAVQGVLIYNSSLSQIRLNMQPITTLSMDNFIKNKFLVVLYPTV